MAIRKAVILDATGSLAENIMTDAVGMGHLAGTTGLPSVAASGVSLGSGGATVAGNDLAGCITIPLGTISIAATLVIAFTASSSYPSVPYIQLQAASAAAATAIQAGQPYQSAGSVTGWSITLPIGIAVSGGTLKINYFAAS